MVDQNPQVNQNVNNQNENDELFGGSDDIFENSDLLQPINSEVDTAHQVIKSQNDLNNFSDEVQGNQTQNENLESDDLFEQPQAESNSGDEHLNGLYDDEKSEETPEDLGINDDIFESPEAKEEIQEIQEIPEIVENIDESEEVEQETQAQPEEIKQVQTEPKIGEPVEQVSQVEDNQEEIKDENDVENIDENNDDDDDFQSDLETLNEIDDLDDTDSIDYEENDNIENDENKEDTQGFTQNNVPQEKTPEEDDEEEEVDMSSEQTDFNTKEDEESFNDTDEEDQEGQPQTDEEEKENITVQDYEKYDPNLFNTDVQKKFGELQRKTEKIHELVGKDQNVGFDLLGGNDDRKKIIYKILSGSDYVEIEKEELNKEDESTITNILAFELEEDFDQNMGLKIYVNDIVLYDEIPDLQNDPNKKMQVLEKMNKFIFLLDEEYKKIQKYKKEKEEKNAVKGVFRNF